MKKNKTILIAALIIIVLLIVILCFMLFNKKEESVAKTETLSYGRLEIEEYDTAEKYKDVLIKDYNTYREVISYYGKTTQLEKNDFDNNDYLVVIGEMDYCGGEINTVEEASVEGKVVNIKINIEKTCGPCASEYYLYLVPFKKDILPNDYIVEYDYVSDNVISCDSDVTYKPLIYLYPEEEISITVRLLNSNKLTTTYPKYKDSWKVLAQPNGDLIDLETGRTYYGLYWEGFNTITNDIREEGFVVKGEDTVSFLEEKLSILGLNEREANEFIIYWLPKLEHNSYNYIYFESMEEINQNMPLEINPTPNSIIRINMEYKALDNLIEVKEQVLETPNRDGFTVVEWGGTELK